MKALENNASLNKKYGLKVKSFNRELGELLFLSSGRKGRKVSDVSNSFNG